MEHGSHCAVGTSLTQVGSCSVLLWLVQLGFLCSLTDAGIWPLVSSIPRFPSSWRSFREKYTILVLLSMLHQTVPSHTYVYAGPPCSVLPSTIPGGWLGLSGLAVDSYSRMLLC